MNWYRIDERREISADFITCAEYQLFLDEKRTQGEYHQPDHWDVHQFPKGQSQKPILGVRGKDASQFCEWLSRRKGNKFRYRLPTLEEVSSHPGMASGDISCWCAAGEKWFIHEFNPTQWKEWWRLFLSAFTNDWSCVSRALAEASDPTLTVAPSPLPILSTVILASLFPSLAFVRDLDLASTVPVLSPLSFLSTSPISISTSSSTALVLAIVTAPSISPSISPVPVSVIVTALLLSLVTIFLLCASLLYFYFLLHDKRQFLQH